MQSLEKLWKTKLITYLLSEPNNHTTKCFFRKFTSNRT